MKIFKRFHIIQAINTRNISTYLPPHSLLELPVLTLQNMCNVALLLCHFSINAPIQNRLFISIEIKRPHVTLKIPP